MVTNITGTVTVSEQWIALIISTMALILATLICISSLREAITLNHLFTTNNFTHNIRTYNSNTQLNKIPINKSIIKANGRVTKATKEHTVTSSSKPKNTNENFPN